MTSLSSGQPGDFLVEEIARLLAPITPGRWTVGRWAEGMLNGEPDWQPMVGHAIGAPICHIHRPGVPERAWADAALIAAAPDLLKRAAQKITTLEEIARRERVAGFRSGFVEALAIHGNTLVNDRDIPALADEAAAHYDKCLPVEWPNGYAPNSAVSQPALSEDPNP